MANITTRTSVLAIKKETTEGTPVVPTAGTDAIAMQDDFSIEPAFDELENAELKSSIGAAKTILGMENPTMSFSHYFRASGVEGTAPNYGALLESFMGGLSTASTEYNTVSSSTVSLIKVDTGEGATFERGEGLLIKDPTNGYRVRCIDSISSDDLTIGFNLPTAPGTGVDLGKCVLYKPANSAHPSVTSWLYRGNGGDLEMMSGGKVTGLTIDAAAGEYVNANYSLEGLGAYFNPITLTSSFIHIDWTDDAGTFAASVEAKTYKEPKQLADALALAMNDQTTETITVTYSNTTGKFTIACATSAVLTIKWNTGANTATTIGSKLGFSVAADDSGALTYTSDNAVSFAFGYTASYDSSDPVVAKNIEVMIGDATDYACFAASNVSISGTNTKADLMSLCAETGKAGAIIAGRTYEMTVTARLSQYDADMWTRYRNATTTKFQMTVGPKVSSTWTAGKIAYAYCPTCTVTSFNVSDQDGLAVIEIGLKAYVNDSGEGEFYLGFL